MSTPKCDVVVVGAGPYGLATAAALLDAGVFVRVFGAPMSFWQEHMPRGMFLRSPWAASHIGHPASRFSLDEFERLQPSRLSRPVPLGDFVAYGHWFRERAVPEVDERQIVQVDPIDGGFRVRLEDGETIQADRVIVAAGISAFASRPAEFAGLPAELASHSSDHADLGRFRGRRVAVIGGGQSAIESAALLSENGAEVELIMRTTQLHWVGRAPRRGLVGRLLFDRTDVGPALVSHVVARPTLVRRLPVRTQRYMTRRALVAGGALWLRPRIAGVTVTTGRHVVAATRSNGHLNLALDDGATREIDHALLATGYQVDVRRYEFLGGELVRGLATVNGQPVLRSGLESSIPGLHFAGAPAVRSFGPLLRFVAGTGFAAGALVRAITGRATAARRSSSGVPGLLSERRTS
jgi:cation diffusion facilitator CzcD-associated flavoprotein CzcO